MSEVNDVLVSAKNIAVNVDDLIQDIINLDQHEHDENDCTGCLVVFDEGKEAHEHDTWSCSDCESMADDVARERVENLDPSDLMDQNWDVWQSVGEEAVDEYKQQVEAATDALKQIQHLVSEMTDIVSDIGTHDLTSVIDHILRTVYGVKDEEPASTDIIAEITGSLDEKMDSRVAPSCECSACK